MVQARSEVNFGEVTKQTKHYSHQQTSPVCHLPKTYPERHFLDLPQTIINQHEVFHP